MSMAVCLDAWSKTRGCFDTAIEKSELLLAKITEKYRMGLVGPDENHADSWIFEDMARLWLRSRNPGCSDRITALLEEMENLQTTVPGLFRPTENLFILALDAVSVSEERGGGKALVLFDKLQRLSGEGLLPTPSLRILSSVLASVTKSSSGNSVRKTCEIYETMLEMINDGDSTEALPSRTLSVVFRSILRSTNANAAGLAMTILSKTVDCARRHPRLVSPNTRVFNAILAGFAKKHLPDEAWETLELMQSLSNEGFETNPDIGSLTSVAKAVGSARTPLTLERVDSLVSQVFQLYGEGELAPDTHLFNSILIAYKNSWSLHPSTAERAYNLLLRLEDLSEDDSNISPDILSYRTVCNTLSKSRIPGAPAMCEDVYLRARARAEQGRIAQLDRGLYSAAIISYARNIEKGSLEKAEAIVEEMELRRQVRESKRGSPDTLLYNRMLSAYANSGKEDKTAKAMTMFKQMKDAHDQGDMDCKPDIFSYNSVSYFCFRRE
jgi:pentatricopeptide repeat protein